MKRELTFQLLRSVLPDPPWSEDALQSILQDLRVLADHKYNKYEMYQPGRLFFENLYLWLAAFEEHDRTSALEFVRRRLIFISREEFQQLAHVLYHDGIRQKHLELASKASGIPRHQLRLLGALQRNAPLRGPIVMDSPFGRLDDTHTTKVVQSLPSMADQVMLLVYESELDPKQARNELKGKLRKEYRIERVSARHSELKPFA
jgi:hypothetical protein